MNKEGPGAASGGSPSLRQSSRRSPPDSSKGILCRFLSRAVPRSDSERALGIGFSWLLPPRRCHHSLRRRGRELNFAIRAVAVCDNGTHHSLSDDDVRRLTGARSRQASIQNPARIGASTGADRTDRETETRKYRCRITAPAPRSGVRAVSADHESDTRAPWIADAAKPRTSPKSSPLLCANCQLHDAALACRECARRLCRDCDDRIHRIGRFRGHERAAIVVVVSPAGPAQPANCQNCEMAPASSICDDCGKVLCVGCIDGLHRPVRFQSHRRRPLLTSLPSLPLICSNCEVHGADRQCGSCPGIFCHDCDERLHAPTRLRSHAQSICWRRSR